MIRVTKDGFVWLDVSDKAKEIFNSGLFELFILHEDESESLVQPTPEGWMEMDTAMANGLKIAVEVGRLTPEHTVSLVKEFFKPHN